jgi:alpha-tubulin suppressor-like RCC1 family protein
VSCVDLPTGEPSTPALSVVVEVAVGSGSRCARKRDGTLWCWGRNSSGELGDGTTEERIEPVQVQGLQGVSSFAISQNHSCAIITDGSAWCWGSNSDGQVGDAGGVNTAVPVPLRVAPLAPVSRIAVDAEVSCATDEAGELWCWGISLDNVLNPGTGAHSHPAPLPLPGPVDMLALGPFHACVVSRGVIWCLGRHLGDGTSMPSATATRALLGCP